MTRQPTAPPQTSTDPIEEVNAVTLAVHDMAASTAFYEALGFRLAYGDAAAPFVSFKAGRSFVNLFRTRERAAANRWGRIIFHVDDVDAMHERALAAGYAPQMAPSDAPWGERYFHILDPDGHELSFARRLDAPARA